MGFFFKKKEKKETNNKINPELSDALNAFSEACSDEGEKIAGAWGAVIFWYKKDFTEKNITFWSLTMSNSILMKEYDITKEQFTTASKAGMNLAKIYSEDESSNLIGLMERTEVADELSSEGKGDLITLLCFPVYLTLNYDPDIYDKLNADIRDLCIKHLDGGDIFEQCESLAEEICDEYEESLNKQFPLKLYQEPL